MPNLIRDLNPVVTAVIAALMIIFALLLIRYPLLAGWFLGISLIAGAVALLTLTFTGNGRARVT
jgi:hypothetical protein